jgi:hypothetical protein
MGTGCLIEMMNAKICRPLAVLILVLPQPTQGSETVSAILDVSHVTKNGEETRETRMHVMRDHHYYLQVVNQTRPYRLPNCKQFFGVLSDRNFQRITSLIDSPKLREIRTSQGLVPLGDRADIWYVAVHRKEVQFLIFSKPQSRPPEKLVAWLEEATKQKPLQIIPPKPDSFRCALFSEDTESAWRTNK